MTLGLADMALVVAAGSSQEPGQGATVMPAAIEVRGKPARVLSAFFGLDNGLPLGANLICLGASGQDGMPVVFSHTLDVKLLIPNLPQQLNPHPTNLTDFQ